jgi:hypothetical protein
VLSLLGSAILCLGHLGLAQAANPSSATFTTDYAASNLRLEIPGEDSYDWWGAFQRDMVAISTHFAAIQVSTFNAETLIIALGSSTGTLRTDLTALQTLAGTLGTSTDTARTDITALQSLSGTLGASTGTLGGVVGALGVSTGSLASIKASSGINTDITQLTGLSSGGLPNGSVLAADLGTLGITSACASGFHMSTITVVNGLVTGGGCISDGAGGSSGHTIASGTVSGGLVGVRTGALTARSTMYFDTAGFELFDDANGNASIIKSKVMQTIASSVTTSGTDVAVTAASLGACVAGSTIAWTQGNNRSCFWFRGPVAQDSNATFKLSFLVDGAYPSSAMSSSKGATAMYAGASILQNASFFHCTETPLSAGTHNACLTGQTDSGTINIGGHYTGTDLGWQFGMMELNTGGQGYNVPASTQTVGFSGTFSGATNGIGISGSTVTLVTRGGDVIASFSGYIKNTAGVRTSVGMIVDGAYTTACKQTSNIFLSDTYDTTATAPVQAAFTCRISGLSTGSHSFALTGGVTSGTGSICDDASTPDANCVWRIDEIIGAAGSGDASTNGTNVWSGSNSFYNLGYSTEVYLTGTRISGAANTFSGVTQSSLTWTSNGEPGWVEFNASVYADGATYLTFGFYLNGVLQEQTSGVVKGQQVYTTASGITMPIHFRIPIQPVVGSNTISLAYAAGANYTITFGGWTASSVKPAASYFGFYQR